MVGLLAQARRISGLTQAEVARLAGTSRATLSAYEHGRRSPTLQTLERILDVMERELAIVPSVEINEHLDDDGSSFFVPTALRRLPTEQAVARIVLPRHFNLATRGYALELHLRSDRVFAYGLILNDGRPDDIADFIDGALLIDAWPDLELSAVVRAAWQPLIDHTMRRPVYEFLRLLTR